MTPTQIWGQALSKKDNSRLTSKQPNVSKPCYVLSLGKYKLTLGKHTKTMGILNITPDSFSADGLVKTKLPLVLKKAQQMVKEGADILDVGGESTRPQSKPVSVSEERKRVIPVIALLAKKVSVPISIDTYKPEIAREALDNGAVVVNTILGTPAPRALLKIVKQYNASIVLMHMRGTPQTMQTLNTYKNLMSSIYSELQKSIEECLEIGIASDKIIIDPGIGFAKTFTHNAEIINRLYELHGLHCPILIGPSRKSFIGAIVGKDIKGRLEGTLAAVTCSILRGAHIVRVHDVAEVKDAVCVTDAILNERVVSTQ